LALDLVGRRSVEMGAGDDPHPGVFGQRPVGELWRRFVDRALSVLGSFWSFVGALFFLLGWTAVGPAFGFSDTWQLVLNTVASVVAFLLVFLIQYSQNRDTRAIHLKLDELLRSGSGSRTRLIRLEQLTDSELDRLEAEFQALRDRKPRSSREAERRQPGLPASAERSGGSG
jgi:low affinity Fe/Cu permease